MIWGSFNDCDGKHGWGSSKDSCPSPPPQSRTLAGEQMQSRGLHLPGPLHLRGDICLVFADGL